jgi:putative transcriptional regulator
VSKLGKRLIQAAREGVAIARGELDPATYRVRNPDDREIERAVAGLRSSRKSTSKAAKKTKRA